MNIQFGADETLTPRWWLAPCSMQGSDSAQVSDDQGQLCNRCVWRFQTRPYTASHCLRVNSQSIRKGGSLWGLTGGHGADKKAFRKTESKYENADRYLERAWRRRYSTGCGEGILQNAPKSTGNDQREHGHVGHRGLYRQYEYNPLYSSPTGMGSRPASFV